MKKLGFLIILSIAVSVAAGGRGENVSAHWKLVMVLRDKTPEYALARIKPYVREGDLVLRDTDKQFPEAKGVRFYASAKQLLKNLPKLSLDIAYICYDPEHWAATPADEQTDLVDWVRRAGEAVRASGRIFMLTPDKEFNQELAGNLAPFADIYDLQGQGSQREIPRYREYYRKIVPQVRRANPAAVVLCQITVSRQGWTAEEAMTAWDSVKDQVDGVVVWYAAKPESLAELFKVLESLRP